MVNLSDKIIVKLELQPTVNIEDAFHFLEELIGNENPTNGAYIRGKNLYCVGDKEIFGELFKGKFWYSNTVGRWLALEDLIIPPSLETYAKKATICDY
ncbi:MAG: hypothetical protein AABX39_01260, partial [Nanoarchaeota archaeon]